MARKAKKRREDYARDPAKFKALHAAWYQKMKDEPTFKAKAQKVARLNWRARRERDILELSGGRARPDRCDVCGLNNGKRPIFLDHCHTSGKFRGWLCASCNAAIGMAKDSPALLRKLADYLEAVA